MKKILITGSKGFIGKALVKKLLTDYPTYKVFEFDREQGDIVIDQPEWEKIDHVIHLAGKTFVPQSWVNPYEFYKINVGGTNNILEFCKKNNSSLTYISSYVYGIPNTLPVNESDPLSAINPYMHSKILAESLCKFYSKFFNVKVVILRPFNVFGPEQNTNFIIPLLIEQLLRKNSKFIFVRDIKPKRDFIYLNDLINAIILTINSVYNFRVYNVGSGISFSVKDIIEKIFKITNQKKEIKIQGDQRANDIPDVRADITRIRNELGWSPEYSLEDGLIELIKLKENDEM